VNSDLVEGRILFSRVSQEGGDEPLPYGAHVAGWSASVGGRGGVDPRPKFPTDEGEFSIRPIHKREGINPSPTGK
jgi:hypothetical protein